MLTDGKDVGGERMDMAHRGDAWEDWRKNGFGWEGSKRLV